MSPVEQKPIIHGRDHLPAGADPIPGLFTNPAVDDYEAIVLEISDLRGYWRLGESASPCLDTSGYDVGDPANLSRTAAGVAMTFNAEGALPSAYDDGAVIFNYAGTSGSGGDVLVPTAYDAARFDFNSVNPPETMSVAAWIKPLASATTFDGGIVAARGNVATGGGYPAGWALYMSWPAREALFWRGGVGPSAQSVSAGVLPADQWTHLCGTYDGTDIRIYVDGALADTVASAVDLDTLGLGAAVGQMTTVSYLGRFYGSLDEAAVWSKALSAVEVARLAAAGSASGGSGAEYEVLTSDGAGSTRWALVEGLSIDVSGAAEGDILTIVGGIPTWAPP